jgi:hypothetical protein
MRRALGWTAGFLSVVLIVGLWWVFNVYAPVPSDVEYAVFSSVHVQAHEGGIESAFEPGFPIRSRAIQQR